MKGTVSAHLVRDDPLLTLDPVYSIDIECDKTCGPLYNESGDSLSHRVWVDKGLLSGREGFDPALFSCTLRGLQDADRAQSVPKNKSIRTTYCPECLGDPPHAMRYKYSRSDMCSTADYHLRAVDKSKDETDADTGDSTTHLEEPLN